MERHSEGKKDRVLDDGIPVSSSLNTAVHVCNITKVSVTLYQLYVSKGDAKPFKCPLDTSD